MKPKEIPPLNLGLIPIDGYKMAHKMPYDEETKKELRNYQLVLIPRGKVSKKGILKISKKLAKYIINNE